MEGQLAEADAAIEALALESFLGPVYIWVGRRAPGYGAARGGGLVLSGAVPLDGIGAGFLQPQRLPSFLKRLGHADFELILGRASDNGDIGKPWLLAGRGFVLPHERVALGATRGMMFGGDGSAEMTVRHFFEMLAGAHPRTKDGPWPAVNQIASFDVVWTPRVGDVPLVVFLEWGMEDSAGAWVKSPGIVSGIEVAHPGGTFRLGLERAYMSGINGHGVWYRHFPFLAGWSDAGRILGHPLGGPGTEWLLHGAVHGDEGRWDLEVGLRTRHRLAENSFSPDLQGRSFGGFVNGWVRTGPVDRYVQVDGERTRSGTERVVGQAGVRWSRGWRP